MLLLACAKDSDTPAENNKATNNANIPEYRVIELVANINSSSTNLEGIWESVCHKNNNNINYIKERRIYHLNGVFKEIAIYNDKNCRIRNSANNGRLIGTFNPIDSLQLFNGVTNIDVNQISITYNATPTRGRPIPLDQITEDDLLSHSTAMEAFVIIGNRLYISEDYGPNSYALLNDGTRYLINQNLDTNNMSNNELNQAAINLLNP